MAAETPKKFMSNKLDLRVVPVPPRQQVRTPKDIKNLKIQPNFQGVPKGGF